MLKNILKTKTFLIVVLAALMLAVLFGCRQASNSGNPTLPGDPTFVLNEELIIRLFDLKRGEDRASDAAKKIENFNGTYPEGLIIEEKNVSTYNDKEGFFNVKIKGKKDNKPFEKELKITNFPHPYSGINSFVLDGSVTTSYFKFDDAIDNNLSIDKFIEKTKDISYQKEHIKPLILTLKGGKTKKTELGDFPAYKLSLQIKKENDKILIQGIELKLKLKLKTKTSDGTINQESISEKITRSSEYKYKYFTKKDVFNRIYSLIKDKPSLIKLDKAKFASEFFAVSVSLNKGGDIIFENADKNEIIRKYQEKYAAKTDDTHLKLEEISPAIYDVRHDGIAANDYEGSLTVNVCITDRDGIEKAEAGEAPDDDFYSSPSTITRKGFQKIVEEKTINGERKILPRKDLFIFSINKKTSSNIKTEWTDYEIKNNNIIIRETEHAWDSNNKLIIEKNILKETNSRNFYLGFNGTALSKSTDLPSNDDITNFTLLTKTKDSKSIFIRNMRISKKRGEEKFYVKITYEGMKDPVVYGFKPTKY